MNSRGLPRQASAEHEFEAELGLPEPLPKGERMLWQGSPEWRILARDALHTRQLSIYFAVLLGWRGASWVGGLIGRFMYRPIGIRAGVVERQIAAAFPEFSRARILEVARRSYDSLGRTSIETAVLPGTGLLCNLPVPLGVE